MCPRITHVPGLPRITLENKSPCKKKQKEIEHEKTSLILYHYITSCKYRFIKHRLFDWQSNLYYEPIFGFI